MARIDQFAIEVHGNPATGENIERLDAFLSGKGYDTQRHEQHMLWAWR